LVGTKTLPEKSPYVDTYGAQYTAPHEYQRKARSGNESTWKFEGLLLRFNKRGTASSAFTMVEIEADNAEVSAILMCRKTANLRMVEQA
jgi:hypothetical protein